MKKRVCDLGELGLIEKIKSQVLHLSSDVVGIGDDCAVIGTECGESLLATTDTLIEGIHFLRETCPFFDLGFKSLAVNLSDIAAMGGTPKHALVSLSLPPEMEVDDFEEFWRGFFKLANQFQVALVGGDTTGSLRDLAISITLLGTCDPFHLKFRSGARAEDIICVTGFVGDSAAGFRLLQEKVQSFTRPGISLQDFEFLTSRHLRPLPQVEQGIWFGKRKVVHAMMDLSDGILSDLSQIMSGSRLEAVVELESLPLSHEFRRVCDHYGWPAIELALTGGEDYLLLLTVDPKEWPQLQQEYFEEFGENLHPVGQMLLGGSPRKNQPSFLKEGRIAAFLGEPFDHFSGSKRGKMK